MKDYYVYYGEEKYPFEIPSGWRVVQNTVFEETEVPLSLPEMVKKALAAPISSPRLSEIVCQDSKVALIVDDWTRSTPVSRVLPAVLEELHSGGVKRENVDIVAALGTHQPMPQQAIANRIGEAVFQEYRVTQHDCHAEDLVPIGRLSTGGEVKINPIVARADVKIGVGSIVPHHITGFGGGAKIIMPGICNFEAVKEHHLHFTLQPDCYIGHLETNPAYQENCRLAEMSRLTFVVNCVYNSRATVADVVAGHFQKAHLAGAERSKENYGFRLDEPADVTITSAYPYLEGPQVVKPVVSASLSATKPGGTVIIVAASRSPLPESMLAAFDAVYSGAARKEGSAFFSPALIYVPASVARNSIIMVSRDLDEKSITRLGFRYADSLEEAIEQESRVRPKATVNIFPIGGLLLPLAKEPPVYE